VSSANETAANRATFFRLHDAFNSGDIELVSTTIDEVVDPHVRIGTPLPVDARGAEALKRVWVILLRAYPDLHVAVEDLIAVGDKLVSRNTVTGTNLGEYLGRPATGSSVTYDEIFIFRFVNGRVVETWGVVDVLSQLRQLGVLSV
jgi:predicted ester cyclase